MILRTARLGLLLAVTAAVVLAAGVGAVPSARGASAACTSLRNVIGFAGTASETVGAAASGTSGRSGEETIQLGRVLSGVHFRLLDKHHGGPFYDFKGTATGGSVQVDDFYQDTGSDYAGELKYNATAGASVSGLLIIGFASCEYEFIADATVDATYSGDSEVNFGTGVSFGFRGRVSPLPPDLKLHADETAKTFQDCETATGATCGALGSTWMDALTVLIDCGNTDPAKIDPSGSCVSNTNPDLGTPATFSYTLTPIFKSIKKKKK